MPLWQETTIGKLASLGSPWHISHVKVLWGTLGTQACGVKRPASDQNLHSWENCCAVPMLIDWLQCGARSGSASIAM